MLIQFSVKNFKSFKDEAILSMKASSGKENPKNIAKTMDGDLLKSVSIFGANAAGKSNIIKALVAAVMTIRTSNRRQIDMPMNWIVPFAFSDDGLDTSFEFEFIADGIKHIYGFSCTRKRITEEYLYIYNTKKPSLVFSREFDEYEFPSKLRGELYPLAERNIQNKLFLATATEWNSASTRQPFLWFSKAIDVFDPSNIAMTSIRQLENDKDGILRSFTNSLMREADINISDYEIESKAISEDEPPFMLSLPNGSPVDLVERKAYRIKAKHMISVANGDKREYELPMEHESKGTRNLFFLSPQIKRALDNGYVFCVDELDSSLHPALLLFLVGLFNSPETNKRNAQLIITAHSSELLSINELRRDQIMFVEKDNNTGTSSLYSLDDFSVRKDEDIRKAYLAGRYGAVPNIIS